MSVQKVTYLDINPADFPVNRIYNFSDKNYLFKFKKNDAEFYTVEIWDKQAENMLWSNKLTYGQPLMDSENAPFIDLIIPLSLDTLNGESTIDAINDDTLGTHVKLITEITE